LHEAEAREVVVVESLNFPVCDTRARAAGMSCFPCQTAGISSPPFSPHLLSVSRLLLRVRLCTCRRADAVTRRAPSFRRCCATSTVSAATTSTAATTTRNLTALKC
jgi:hypothetical protein